MLLKQPPAGTAELALIVQDPDVPFGKPATHALALYAFQLFALGQAPGLPASFTLDDVIAAIKGHVPGRARLDGTYEIR